MKSIYRVTLILALSACLIGCETETAATKPPSLPASAYSPIPKRYQTLVAAWIKAQLKDPYSAHIEFVGNPTRSAYKNAAGQWAPCYLVMVFVNAKNSFGGYTGNKAVMVGIAGNEIVYPYGLNPMSLAM